MTDRFATVFFLYVLDHTVTIRLTEVDIKVRHRDPLGVQKSLKQQIEFERVEIGNPERIRHQRARTRASARSHRATIVLCPSDEVPHDQEVARKPHVEDGANLKVETLDVPWCFGGTLFGVGVKVCQSALQALMRQLLEVVRHWHGGTINQGGRKIR